MEPKDTQADKLFNTLLELRKRVNDGGTDTTTVEIDFWEHDHVAPWTESVICHDSWRGFTLTAGELRTYIRCNRDEELWRSEVEVAFRYLRGFLAPLKFKQQAISWMANAVRECAGSALMLPWGTGFKRLVVDIDQVKDGVLCSVLPGHNEELFKEAERTFGNDKLLLVAKPQPWSVLLPESSFAQLNALYDRMAAELPKHFDIAEIEQVKLVQEN